ncbi:1,5-anhydro-D-fructose reductase-like [Gigantopelta aegis]|uniref:1,5-anhydro-D-fructose reductase-like n=1 Tax=Gigantopelta aegis TaxID=1735272 RepID=UPI001B88B0C9|nr:1,5-anhydro-D-fructose reductase-like [Gigantopelta aegis]
MSGSHQFELTMKSGRKMPAIGLGTYAPKESEGEVITAVKSAVRAGYRHLDCAALFRNEVAVGHAIKHLIVEGVINRQQLFISSKLWNTCHQPDLVRTSLKKTISDLGVGYLDLYLMHWPMTYKEGGDFVPRDESGKVIFSDVDFLDTWKALEDCVDEGLVHDIGVSNFNSKQVLAIQNAARIAPSNIQIEAHCWLSNVRLIEFCQSRGLTVTALSPLASPGNFQTHLLDEKVLKDIATKKNKSPAQVALRFLLQQGVGVLPKSTNPTRIAENINIFNFELSKDEMQLLFSLNKNQRLNSEEISRDHKYYPFCEDF